MPKWKDITLINKLEAVAGKATDAITDCMYCINDSEAEYNEMSQDYGSEDLLLAQIRSAQYADEDLKDAMHCLTEFDKQLAKMIQLRAELAAETGFPLLLHLGNKK